MARTTAALVKGVLLRDYDTANNPDLTPFIDTASSVIDKVVTCAANRGVSLSAADLELMERWLAAHCYAMSDKPYAEKTTMKAKGVFDGRTGMYLEGTRYGQTATSLDSSGCLAAIASGRKRVTGTWLGYPPSQQTDYQDRN